MIDKYGGQEHLKAPPKELLIAQTENYVEYSRTGQVIKGQEKAKVRNFKFKICLVLTGADKCECI